MNTIITIPSTKEIDVIYNYNIGDTVLINNTNCIPFISKILSISFQNIEWEYKPCYLLEFNASSWCKQFYEEDMRKL